MADAIEKEEIKENKKEAAYQNRPSVKFQAKPQEVVVVDVSIPFWSMVVFMVKWSIASIPAFLILIIIGIVFAGVFGIGALVFR